METKYPTLRRPKRKLCYVNFTNKERPSNQLFGVRPLSLGDIDNMFDDLDPTPTNEDVDLLPSTTLLRISDTMLNENEGETPTVPQQEGNLTQKNSSCQKGPNEDVLNPAKRSPSPEPDIDLDSPFNAHGPVKTSSPIEENMIVKGVEEPGVEKHRVISPILFACEDEGKEEARMDRLFIPKSQCNEQITKQSDDSEFESPPRKVVLSKPKMSSQKNKVEGSCKESDPVKEKTADLEGKRKAPRQENTEPPMTAVRQEPGAATPGKKSEGVHRQPPVKVSTRVEKDMTAFLQKLREAVQSKPSCSRKSLSPVKVPNPPEPEDDFLILEDDTPLFITIPSKSATNKRQSKTSSIDKDSSTDKGAKDTLLESAQKQQESEQANGKLGSQNVNQKMKMKEKEKGKNEATGPGYEIDEFCSEELPAGDLMEQEKLSKKKQRLKKVPSKQSDKAEDQPEDSVRGEVDKEKNTLTLEKKAQTSSDTKRSKSLKDRSENGKTSKAKSLKGARKVTQESVAVKETVYVEPVKGLQEQSSAEHADAEDLGSLSDKEIMNSEAQMNEKNKQTKQTVVSEESSSEDGQIVGKRKRKRRQPGQWWLNCSQITEETKATDNQPTLKKLKQSNKEPSAAMPSPVKTKKDRGLKRGNQMPPAPSSSQNTTKAKDKKIKQKKTRNEPGDRPDKMKTEVFEAESIEEQQQEIPDQDLESSPLVLAHKDHSLNSGDQVYHRVSNEKTPGTPARDPSGSWEQLREEEPQKRWRKPPSNWWRVNDMSEDVQSISLQTQQQEPKPHKERKKPSKRSTSSGLGTPKNGNMAVPLKPAGGTGVSALKMKPSTKTIRRSLATFKDIFTSAAETATVVSSREAGQTDKHEITVTDCTTHSKTEEDLSMDASESNSPLNPEAPQKSKCQSDNMLKSLGSGPSSMIDLEQCEENDDSILPSTRASAVLSASDLCAPPLAPLILQPKDKANLTEWFKCLWSTTADNGPEITPDQFDWYFHRGRAIGFLVDLNSGFICNGKMLLGSYMKKPLWVDHSATTVFNILTSSVSVIINGCESRFNPGQSFMVPCGHAYSIQNIMSQPAALYFTRVFVESLD